MTQPLNPDPPQAAAVPIQVSVDSAAVPGPDGQPWVALAISTMLMNATLVVPEPMAEDLAKLIPQKLTEAAAQARRAKLGLFLPDGAQLPQMPPVNGHRPNGHAPGPR